MNSSPVSDFKFLCFFPNKSFLPYVYEATFAIFHLDFHSTRRARDFDEYDIVFFFSYEHGFSLKVFYDWLK